ncbi:MAG TPA: hypothetical protein DCM45_02860, partial [Clostridiales bacterium]|nr:hypothetical protein [Clostridiales bacterium]
ADDDVIVQAWHPGSLDYFVYRQGDSGRFSRNFLFARLIDAEALCSPAVKQWIIDHRIELVNYRDALFGTHEMQNHLRAIDSDLFIRC